MPQASITYSLSLHDALPIFGGTGKGLPAQARDDRAQRDGSLRGECVELARRDLDRDGLVDRKSTRLNSSHSQISYAVFCLKKKKTFRRVIRTNHQKASKLWR